MLPNGNAVRRGTYIDIPLEIALPHFIHDDNMNEDGAAFGNFKLSLQSVVCHRGEQVNSGHYISLVRGRAPNASSEEAASNHPDGDRWMLFDDLSGERIKYVNIQQALKDESPYLLFYQVQPIDGDPGNIEQGEKPPTYIFSGQDSLVTTPALNHIGAKAPTTPDGSFEPTRISLEEAIDVESTSRTSWASDTKSSDRRRSVTFTDESLTAPAKPGPIDGARSGNASLAVSRQPSQSGKHGSKSRPNSQSGESRFSASFTRAIGKLTKERPELVVAAVDGKEEDEEGHGRLRKEPKEKRRREGGQSYLKKGEKPERECAVM